MPRKDPRASSRLTLSVNEIFLDRAVRHAVWLEGLKTRVAADFVKELQKRVISGAVGFVAERMEAIQQRGFTLQKRAVNLAKAVAERVSGGVKALYKPFRDDLAEIGIMEADWTAKVVNDAMPIQVRWRTPSLGLVKQIVAQEPIHGATLRQQFGIMARAAGETWRKQVQLGIVYGESMPQIVKRVRNEAANLTRRHATALVRTSVQHTTNRARTASYEGNEDIIKGWLFVATLDSRTTEICIAHDGKTFDLGDGPVPPLHINCRSTTTPVMKSWEEMGIDLEELPEGTRASRSQVEALNGQIPASVTYGPWLRAQPNGVQDQVLGPTRARLFRAGKVKIDRFVSDQGRPLTLDQLRKREGLSVDDVGITRRERIRLAG